MKKKEFIKLLSGNTGLKKKFCEKAIITISESIIKITGEAKNVEIENFGVFKVIRNRASVISVSSGLRTVVPPADKLLFVCSDNLIHGENEECKCPDEMISYVSIENVLSKDAADVLIRNFFGTIKECLRKNKSVEIIKLGKFNTNNKTVNGNIISVEFIPSGKFSKKINHSFSGLKKFTIPVSADKLKFPVLKNEEFDYEISDEFKKTYRESLEEKVNEQSDKTDESGFTEVFPKKKLISDELIKLHNEITEAPNKVVKKDQGLWG